MLAGDKDWWKQLESISEEYSPSDSAEIRRAWEAEPPEARSLVNVSDSDAADMWGISPGVLARWQAARGVKRASPGAAWRVALDKRILEKLEHGKPVTRDKVVEDLQHLLPASEVERCIESRSRTNRERCSESVARRHIINLAIYGLAQTRRGDIRTLVLKGEQYLQKAG